MGILGTKQKDRTNREKVLEYTMKWRVTASVNKCAVLVSNKDEKKKMVELNGRGEKTNCRS